MSAVYSFSADCYSAAIVVSVPLCTVADDLIHGALTYCQHVNL